MERLVGRIARMTIMLLRALREMERDFVLRRFNGSGLLESICGVATSGWFAMENDTNLFRFTTETS